MSKFNNTHKFTAAAAFGAAAIFSMLSFGSSAQAATSLFSCMGSTAGKVVSCCEKLTKAERPLWMIQSRTSCQKATVCRGGIIGIAAVAARRCYVQTLYVEKEGGDNQNEGRGRQK